VTFFYAVIGKMNPSGFYGNSGLRWIEALEIEKGAAQLAAGALGTFAGIDLNVCFFHGALSLWPFYRMFNRSVILVLIIFRSSRRILSYRSGNFVTIPNCPHDVPNFSGIADQIEMGRVA